MIRGKEAEHVDIYLRGALASAGLDITQAALIVGFSRSKMSALANGTQDPTISDIFIIAKQIGKHEEKQARK